MKDNTAFVIVIAVLCLSMTACHGIDRFSILEKSKIECKK